jgi:hypothetical protein
MALRAVCGAFLLAAALSHAQEQPGTQEPLPQAGQETQAVAETVPVSVVATLHGVVRNAATGEPLPRALVEIEGNAQAGTLTDGEGRFELLGVPVGPQTIKVRKPGFQDRPYATEDVGYQGDGPAHNVLVAAEMPALDFALTPTSAIHGRVELSTGDPGQGITLVLLKQVVRNGRAVWSQNGTAKTNGEGAYRFAGLPSGVYALYTVPVMESEPAVSVVASGAKVVREGYASVFYPGVREFSGATRIRIAAGQQAEANLLLTLEPFYAVTAKAILPNGKVYDGDTPIETVLNKLSRAEVVVLDSAGQGLAYNGQLDETTHTVRASLPNGVYTLLVKLASSLRSRANTARSGSHHSNSVDDAEISAATGFVAFSIDGHPISNLRIPTSPKPSWQIHLRFIRSNTQAGSANPGANQGLQRYVTVTSTNTGEAPMDETYNDVIIIGDSGPDSLEMNGVGPGSHWISTEVSDRSLCVDSFSAGAINLAREPLSVALGASPPPLELTLRDDCAKLTLQLPPALTEFLPGDEPFYTVYVIPDFDTTADIPPMNMHASSGPTLTVEGLTPGSYHVYVFDRPVRLEYRNPAVIAALPKPGQAVTLSAGATSNLLLEVPER